MPTQNQDDHQVVMGYPANYFQIIRPRHDAIIRTPEPPCDNPGHEKRHPCLKWLTVCLFSTVALLSLLVFFGYYFSTYRNKNPDIKIESITATHVKAFPNNTNTVSADWHLTFFLDNPNTFASISYKKIQVSVFDGDERVSFGSLDSFDQKKGEEGRMNMQIYGCR
ncbi:Avr9/Cf-9 rapidly elicited protein [Corchorus olitorius]|uniref:Avr9/Cf-9 rapidly elicited protein n=1 Tax=Corchorus olitorius TaxID=93759 RepID=A0A1R3HZ07_9ROSI|nr:Avr9/Cf-9 rapidly elicited protein [Corchorus olitorius]